VLIDGELANSCLVPVSQVDRGQVTTVEGLADEQGNLGPLQQAFLAHGAAQCGICTPGMLIAARAYIDQGGDSDEGAIRESIAGNLCRCTGYTKIIDAIAAATMTSTADR
jgi:aerobic-type carbon monoxide dehydrogenase small subunit (CoxS/CutS family)